jgi:hypothetical protein
VRVVLAAAAAVALTLGISAGSRVPVTFSDPDDALLRLSWRMRGITAEECRTLTGEELERLPVHMRNPQACIGVIASYALDVTVDGTLLAADTIRPPGARGDRPLNVLREYPLAPGEHQVRVRFRAILPEGVDAPADGIIELAWEGGLRLGGRDVALVTLDEGGRSLVVRTPER